MYPRLYSVVWCPHGYTGWSGVLRQEKITDGGILKGVCVGGGGGGGEFTTFIL